ncbi:hypothetical protein [Pseudophaeobacter sp.]|uniref:hypothetical protein n=1 Tax=Pseudophaeobacter sp. TaxID=1971739 RepID=UPI003296A288
MPTKTAFLSFVFSALCASAAVAQAPLTVIDWLGQPDNSPPLPNTVLLEPPVAGSAAQPQITVTPLQALLPPIGLVAPAATGLPVDLWRGSDPKTIAKLIRTVSVQDSPAMQSLLFTLLLSESRPLLETGDPVLLARLDRLIILGATDPAQALVEQVGPAKTPAIFRRWFFTTLLSGDEDRACAAMIAAPYLAPNYSARVFCAARSGDWPTAALMLETAHALEILPNDQLQLLDRFLNPDIFELAPPLPIPTKPDPLTFRLYETIGEPLPTAPLARAFAAADLRDVAGWKAQLEAAERLTRAGALNPNQLLGLYTERSPAASGGIWDRVAALQKFEAALNSASSDEVANTLPAVWAAMQSAGLEVGFADLFAITLARFKLSGDVADLAWRIRLLAPSYEIASHSPPSSSARNDFLSALAQGRLGNLSAQATTSVDQPGTDQKDTEQSNAEQAKSRGTLVSLSPAAAFSALAHEPLAQSIARGFNDVTPVPQQIRTLLDNGQLGEAILRSMALFEQGAQGNLGDLSGSLAALRAIGLEDTARRAALQLMLLERG